MAQALIPATEWQSLVERHPLLGNLPAAVAAAARLLSFSAGDVLFLRGARPKAMLYVLDGEVRLIRHTADGRTVVLQRRRRGFIAEASMDTKVYHCDIVASADGNLLTLPIAKFRQGLAEHEDFRGAWMSGLASEIRRLRAQNERLHLKKAADRVLHYLETEGIDGVVALNEPIKAWAAELALTHEGLYRALALLEKQGRIQRQDNVLKIQNATSGSGRPIASSPKSPKPVNFTRRSRR